MNISTPEHILKYNVPKKLNPDASLAQRSQIKLEPKATAFIYGAATAIEDQVEVTTKNGPYQCMGPVSLSIQLWGAFCCRFSGAMYHYQKCLSFREFLDGG